VDGVRPQRTLDKVERIVRLKARRHGQHRKPEYTASAMQSIVQLSSCKACVGVQIVRRVNSSRGRPCRGPDRMLAYRTAVEFSFDRLETMRPTARADYADMWITGPALVVFIVKEGDAGQREIALASREFLEAPKASRWPGRQAQLGDNFIGAQFSDQRSGKELGCSNRPLSHCAENGDLTFAGYTPSTSTTMSSSPGSRRRSHEM
jgi:hypothetical protein